MESTATVRFETVWLPEGAEQYLEPALEQVIEPQPPNIPSPETGPAAASVSFPVWQVKPEPQLDQPRVKREVLEDEGQALLKTDRDIEENSIDPGDNVEEDSEAGNRQRAHDSGQATSSQRVGHPVSSQGQTLQIQYKCLICGNLIPTRYQMEQHIKYHRESKPFPCKECIASFTQRSELSKHFKIHTRARPYKCNKCNKRFRVSYGLSMHLKTHTKNKPYTCVHCGKCFRLKANLARHLRTHSGVKPYKCKECDMWFHDDRWLTKYLLAHTAKCLLARTRINILASKAVLLRI